VITATLVVIMLTSTRVAAARGTRARLYYRPSSTAVGSSAAQRRGFVVGTTKAGRSAAAANALRNGARSASIRRPGAAALYYSTERVLELRSGKSKKDQPKVLYDAKNETENCGVGLIASLKSVPSRDIVTKADEMLVRMSHRGGCGCDPKSGDGSGKRSRSKSSGQSEMRRHRPA